MSDLTIVNNGDLNGVLEANPSKSILQRVCAAAILKEGTSVIKNCGHSNDDMASINIIKTAGAKTVFVGNSAIMKFQSEPEMTTTPLEVNAGESGLTARMFAMVLPSYFDQVKLVGEGSLLTRPFDGVIDALTQMGLKVEAENNKLPLSISGKPIFNALSLDGSISSQFLTGVLLAYSAANLVEETTIEVKDLKSAPYIDMTLQVIEAFGLNMPTNDDYKAFTFKPGFEKTKEQVKFAVEGDWSNASFFMVGAALTGELMIEGLDSFSKQADKAILTALMDAGVQLSIEADRVTVSKSTLKAFHFDATHTPDLFPPLAVLASRCKGTSVIEGVHRLVHKESNRAEALVQTMQTLGIDAKIQDDMMVIEGQDEIKGGVTLDSYNDHRIAMALSVWGLIAKEPISIVNMDAIKKSYPQFVKDMNGLGARIEVPITEETEPEETKA